MRGFECTIPPTAIRADVNLCFHLQAAEKPPLMDTLKVAAWKATGGGLAGAAAMFVNVGTLMCAHSSFLPCFALVLWAPLVEPLPISLTPIHSFLCYRQVDAHHRELSVSLRHVDNRGVEAPLR